MSVTHEPAASADNLILEPDRLLTSPAAEDRSADDVVREVALEAAARHATPAGKKQRPTRLQWLRQLLAAEMG